MLFCLESSIGICKNLKVLFFKSYCWAAFQLSILFIPLNNYMGIIVDGGVYFDITLRSRYTFQINIVMLTLV